MTLLARAPKKTLQTTIRYLIRSLEKKKEHYGQRGKQKKEQVTDILNFSYEKYFPHPVLYSFLCICLHTNDHPS